MAEKALFDAAQSALFLLLVKAQIHSHYIALQTLLVCYAFVKEHRQEAQCAHKGEGDHTG